MKNYCDKDDSVLLKAAYYGNTSFLLTTDGRISKNDTLSCLYPVFCVDQLSKEDINSLPELGKIELIKYAKTFWRKRRKR